MFCFKNYIYLVILKKYSFKYFYYIFWKDKLYYKKSNLKTQFTLKNSILDCLTKKTHTHIDFHKPYKEKNNLL